MRNTSLNFFICSRDDLSAYGINSTLPPIFNAVHIPKHMRIVQFADVGRTEDHPVAKTGNVGRINKGMPNLASR